MLKLNLVHAVAFSGVVLFAGYGLRKFLVVPLVGAFFIDFANALIITVFLNIFK